MKSCAPHSKDNIVTPTNVVDGAVGVEKKYWFIGIVNNNSERKTAERLQDKRMEGAYECYVPTQERIHLWKNGRKKIIKEILLPAMIFIRCTKEKQIEAQKNHYVYNFLKNHASTDNGYYGAAIIPDNQVERFQKMLEKSDKPIVVENRHFKLGDKVKVKSGFLQGIEGNIVRETDTTYLVIGINNLGYAKVQIESSEVELIKEH